MEMNENKKLNFVFFGTPDVASETLEILKAHGYVPSLIVTSPDRPVGRHFTMTPSPTKIWADENNIPTLQPEKITDEVIEHLQSHPPNPRPQGKGESELPSLGEGLGMGFAEQDESQMTHCGKTKKEDGLVDPINDDPEILWRKYRAYAPWPGLHFFKPLPNPPLQGEGAAPKRIKITKARFENKKFIIERVVREGEKESDYFG